MTEVTSKLDEYSPAAICPRTPITYRQDPPTELVLPPASSITAPSRADADQLPAQAVRLSILMTAYNDERTIASAINEILTADYPCDIELIIVDDGSTDGTPTVLSRMNDPRVTVRRHETCRGKGAALLSASSLATGTHILPFSAGLEYSAEDIPRLLEPVLKGRCGVVYGTRLFGCNTVYHSYRYAIANQLLTRAANFLFNAYLSDLHTHLKLMPLALLRNLRLSEQGFGLDSEITARLLRRGIRPFEVPVSFYSSPRADSKNITRRDALATAWILLRVRLWAGRSPETLASAPREDVELSDTMTKDFGSAQAGYLTALAADGDDSQLTPPLTPGLVASQRVDC